MKVEEKVVVEETKEDVTREEEETQKEETSEELGTEETLEENSSSQEETSEESEIDKVRREYEEKISRIQESTQKRIDELTWKTKTFEEKLEKGKEKTWEDLDVDELKKHRERYQEENNSTMVNFLNDTIHEKTTAKTIEKELMMRENNAIRLNSWAEVVKDYPELKDSSSEHYKKTVELIKSNPLLDNVSAAPQGHATAARLVAEQLLRSRIRNKDEKVSNTKKELKRERSKNTLDTSSGSVADSSTPNIEKLMEIAENSGDPHGPEWRKYLSAVAAKNNTL